MRIVQPVTAYNGEAGWVVYTGAGRAVAFILQRDPMPHLVDIVGEHVMLGAVASVTQHQFRRWAANMPGSENLS